MPGPLPGQQVTSGTIFGISPLGTSYYGIGLPPAYLVEPMTAVSNSYTSILVTWNAPSGTIFRYRLIRNRYGFPVNENDGDIIYDTTTYPGNSYTDLDVSPGTYHYYGFYVLAEIAGNVWIRSGFAGCLAVQDYGSGQYLFDLLPEYFTTIPSTGAALTDDAAGNSQLQLFLNVFGWSLDYLRTQYATYADHLNDAWFIPLDDLWNLAQQVGLTFSGDVPAYTVRKATENFAHVAQQRGTLGGIEEEIALRTGYGADVHMGPNILLDDDQAQVLSPLFLQYQPARSYDKDECIWVPYNGQPYWWRWDGDGWWFRSLVNSNLGNTPPAGGTSNSYWQALYDSDDFLATQVRIDTDNPGTWEILDTGATNYLPLPHSATQGLGVAAPPPVAAGANAYAWNTLRFYNRQGSARTLWCRSVSRRNFDLAQIPDPSFEAGTTIAPPYPFTTRKWVPKAWPAVTIPNWMGGTEPVSVPAYWTPQNATLAREDTVAHTGSWAMQVTPVGSPSSIDLNSPWIACPAGTACTTSIYYQAATGGSTVQAQLIFYDAAGNTLATDSGTGVTGTASTWVNATASGTAPSGTQYAAVNIVLTSPVTVSYIDDTTITAALTLSTQPDQIQAVRDGIPVPWVLDSQEWNPAIRYVTNDIVKFDNQPFIALRASTGSVPPVNDVATTDWAPLSQSPRIRLCLSGYTSQNLTNASNYAYAVTPFIEWYDAQGNFIARVFARSAAGNGTVSQPNNMAYDSFTTESVIASAGVAAGSVALGPWNATFWDNTSLSGDPVLTRVDPSVNYVWDGQPPGYGVATSGWSASWVTTYTAPGAGSYGFTLQGNQGGSRLIVNGQTIIDNWAAQSSNVLTASMTLAAGQTITVEIDYYNPQLDDYQQNLVVLGDITTGISMPYLSSKFTVSPGQQLNVSGSVSVTPPLSPADHPAYNVMSLNWFNHSGVCIKTDTFQANTVEPTVFDQVYTAPDGATHLQIVLATAYGYNLYFAGRAFGTWTGLTIGVPEPLPVNSDSLTFSNVTTPAIASSAAQYSYNLAGRVTDDEQSNWTNPLVNTWTIGGFAGGSVWPTNPNAQAIGLITTQPASTSLGVTFRSMPLGDAYAGIIFRYTSTSNYWRSDQRQLGYVSSGVYNRIAEHAQQFLPGDRMTITLNGNSITVYRNGVQVNSASSSFNASATSHGIINDFTGSTEAGPADPLRRTGIRSKTRMPPRPGRGSGVKAIAPESISVNGPTGQIAVLAPSPTGLGQLSQSTSRINKSKSRMPPKRGHGHGIDLEVPGFYQADYTQQY